MTVEEAPAYLREHWPRIREALLAGSYRPSPVLRREIPKPGGGKRQLGIPTVLDRLIQQAILQVLQPLFDPDFSPHSHGFRPGRGCHGAIREAQRYVQAGARVVVDVDLEKFFDRVNHDILMGKLAKRAGERVMLFLRRAFGSLRLRVNEEKSEVRSAFRDTFLGYGFWVAPGKKVRLRVSEKAWKRLKQNVRERSRRNTGRSPSEVFERLGSYLRGWRSYFRLADTPRKFWEADEWIRHRLRALVLFQWKTGPTAYKRLRKLGASEAAASKVAANLRRWWKNSKMLANSVFPIAYFDQAGLPRLAADLN